MTQALLERRVGERYSWDAGSDMTVENLQINFYRLIVFQK